MGIGTTNVTARLRRELELNHGQPALLNFVIAGCLLLAPVTAIIVSAMGLLPPGAFWSIAIIAGNGLVAGGWLILGKRLMYRCQRGYYEYYLAILQSTDLLYLTIEHRQSEVLYADGSPWHKPVSLIPPQRDSFIYRIEAFIKNLDQLGENAVRPRPTKDSAVRCLEVLARILPTALLLAMVIMVQHLEPMGSVVLLIPWFLLVTILSETPQTISLSAKWLVVAEVLLGETEH